jgi:hypothetical protein
MADVNNGHNPTSETDREGDAAQLTGIDAVAAKVSARRRAQASSAPAAPAESEWGWTPDDAPHASTSGPAGADEITVNARPVAAEPARSADSEPRGLRGGAAIAKLILAYAKEPWVPLRLGGDELMSIRPGGIVTETGATGSGKTSLAASLVIEHAREAGPGIAMSLELPGDEFGARIIGVRCDASWPEVLRGEVDPQHMVAAIPDRLVVIERRDASLANLRRWINRMRADYPGEPILVAIDYVQLMPSQEREIRRRVADAMEQIDALARDTRVVVIAVSQASRVNSRALGSNEKLGAETTDAGAEAAELERWATATLAIGGHQSIPEGADSWLVPINIGKARMAGGDMVVMGRYCGRSGKWRLDGAGRPAAEVRAEAAHERAETKVNAARLTMVSHAEQSKEPLKRADLIRVAAMGKGIGAAALAAAIAAGELVEVQFKKKHAPAWQLWTPARAKAAGLAVVGAEVVT